MNKAIEHLVSIARFAGKLASVGVNTVDAQRLSIADIVGLLPNLPGLLADLPHVLKEWGAMGDDDNWKLLVGAFKESFDVRNDTLELFIETAIDNAIEVLKNIGAIFDRVKGYFPAPAK